VRASWLGPPSLVQRCNGQTVSSLSGSLKIRTIGPVRNVWRPATPAPTSPAITSIGVTQPPAAHGRGHQGHGNLSLTLCPQKSAISSALQTGKPPSPTEMVVDNGNSNHTEDDSE
jgi:hypothetical protein